MVYPKNKAYDIDTEELARFAKAMGHPARINILRFLASMDSCFFGDICQELPIAKATVSQHLTELKNAGLIKGNVEGAAICYCINETGFDKVKAFFKLVNSHLDDKRIQCC